MKGCSHSQSPISVRRHFIRIIWTIFALGSCAGWSAQAGAGEVVGAHRLTLVPGPNFISLPLHGASIERGTVLSVAPASLTLAGNPGWGLNQFGPQDGFPQYLVMVRVDASGSPGIEGDWWTVQGNGDVSLSVDNRGEDLTAFVSAGDEVEIRRLTSFRDVFGSGPTLRIISDHDFDILASQEDFIRFVDGTSFAGEVFYHDGALGTAGYYANGDLVGTGDGSTLTVLPGQPLVFFRRSGAPALQLLSTGSVLPKPFTHYLHAGANAVGVVFPVPAPLSTSRLQESGWISDVNFDVLSTEEDLIRAVYGTSFGEEIFHYSGPDDVASWYVDGNPDDLYAFQPTFTYMFFLKGPEILRWRQGVPFTP